MRNQDRVPDIQTRLSDPLVEGFVPGQLKYYDVCLGRIRRLRPFIHGLYKGTISSL